MLVLKDFRDPRAKGCCAAPSGLPAPGFRPWRHEVVLINIFEHWRAMIFIEGFCF